MVIRRGRVEREVAFLRKKIFISVIISLLFFFNVSLVFGEEITNENDNDVPIEEVSQEEISDTNEPPESNVSEQIIENAKSEIIQSKNPEQPNQKETLSKQSLSIKSVEPVDESESLQFIRWGPTRVNFNELKLNTAANAKNTVEFWMYWNGTINEMPISFNNADYDLMFSDQGCFGFNTVMSDCIGVPSEQLKNKWLHVAAVFINGTPSINNVKLYINGQQQALSNMSTKGWAPVSRSVSNSLRISGYTDFYGTEKHYLNGRIKDIAVFNKERTSSEIQNSITNGIKGNEGGLVGYWKLDPVTTQIIYDHSPSKKNGIPLGFSAKMFLSASEINDLGMKLNWDGLTTATGYELKRGEELVYDGPNSTFSEDALVSDTTYSYSLIAKNQNGKSIPVQASYTTKPGNLEIVSVPNDLSFNTVTLNGEAQRSFGTFSEPVIVKDTRKEPNGWHLVVYATPLKSTNGEKSFSNKSISIKPVSSISQTRGLLADEPVGTNSIQLIDEGAPKKLVSAGANTGYGFYEVFFPSDSLELLVNPSNAYTSLNGEPLSYFTDITWSVEAGS